jgi:hypothetical protein
VAARVRFALERSATMVFVKARPEGSGAILRRAGFEAFGRERCFTAP